MAGGAGHIGVAACEALRELGARVAVADLSGDESADLSVVCDLADEHAAREAVRAVVGGLGGLDILVHCAALVGTSQLEGWAVPFGQQTVDAWRRALDVNLVSAFVLAQEAHEALARSGRGSIVLFGSTYGMVGPDDLLYEGVEMANPAAYGASKGGVLQFVRYLATTMAPAVRVNAISPGGVERRQPEAFQDRYRARTPLRRMATEEDLKGAVAYLASDLSVYVTGHNLVVDGGFTAW